MNPAIETFTVTHLPSVPTQAGFRHSSISNSDRENFRLRTEYSRVVVSFYYMLVPSSVASQAQVATGQERIGVWTILQYYSSAVLSPCRHPRVSREARFLSPSMSR